MVDVVHLLVLNCFQETFVPHARMYHDEEVNTMFVGLPGRRGKKSVLHVDGTML